MFIMSTQKNNSNSRSLKISYFVSVCKTNNVHHTRRHFYSISHSAAPWSISVSSMKVGDRFSISFSVCKCGYAEKRIFINL
jgi:hypothetical protein